MHNNPNFWETGGCRGSAMVPFERAVVVSYRLSIVTIALSLNLSAATCCRISLTLKSMGGGHFGAKFGKGLTHVSHILTRYGRHEAVGSKRNRVDVFCCLSTMYEHERQTIEQYRNMCHNRQNHLSAMSRKMIAN